MQKMLKVGLVIAFAAVGIFIFSTTEAGVTAAAATGSVESQASLYRTHCANCHGNNGKSQTKKGRELEADDLTTADVKGATLEKLSRIISNGKADMPSFKRKLSAAQISSIARYIKTL